MADLSQLKKKIFASDNRACFIERERILAQLTSEFADYNVEDRYALILARLLSEVSVPLEDCDFFAGRVAEALPDPEMSAPNRLLCATGHMSPDYETLLRCGLNGILEEIRQTAVSDKEKSFLRNAEIVVDAIRSYTLRYAKEAKKRGFTKMSEALFHVPSEPAYDFYSALQSVWIMHMIASCYVGERDYAFGRLDSYLLPYYEISKRNGMTEEEAIELLAGFFLKTNEICGRGTYNHNPKPILSQASKQYVNIGGEAPNAVSMLILKAAERNNMAQPQITVLLCSHADASFTEAVFSAMSVLTDKLHIYNYDSVHALLSEKGIPSDLAKNFSYSACCTFDLNYHSYRQEYYVPVLKLFCTLLRENAFSSLEELTEALTVKLTENMQDYLADAETCYQAPNRCLYVLDALLLTDSRKRCLYPNEDKDGYKVFNLFCPGIATLGDSLMELDRMVFSGKRFSYTQFAKILENNFDGYEDLHLEIKRDIKSGMTAMRIAIPC